MAIPSPPEVAAYIDELHRDLLRAEYESFVAWGELFKAQEEGRQIDVKWSPEGDLSFIIYPTAIPHQFPADPHG